jgi:iron complex outermembrane recepter protein
MLQRAFTLLLVVLSLHSVAAQSDCTFTLRGKVRHSDTQKPVAFATVFVKELGNGAVTDEQGNFRINHLCRKAYTIDIQHIECQHLTESLSIEGDTEGSFLLKHDDKILQKVEIKAKSVRPVETQAHSQLSKTDLENNRGGSLGDALKTLSGVTTLNTGATIAKPVVQGLHSDRVLILTNGVRQEGQQWGLDHAPEIDPFIADQITVVKGAAAVKYGVGAIGGVVLIEPKALRDTFGKGGEINLVGASNGRSGTFSGFFEQNKGRKSWRIQATARRSGDLQTPQYFLNNTGVLELNASAQLGWEGKNDRRHELFFSHFYSQIGIFRQSHIGNLTDLKAAIQRLYPLSTQPFSYQIERPAQRVFHELLKYKITQPTGDIGKLSIQTAVQFNQRGEYDFHRTGGRRFVSFDTVQIAFALPSAQIKADWEHQPVKNWRGAVGVEGFAQSNTTYAGALIPDYRQATAGIYWTERWRRLPSPFELEAGVRYDFRQLWVDSTRFGDRDRQFRFGNVSGNVGAIFHLNNWGKISANVGTAWRSPNVNELFSLGVHHGTASFERGNADLRPERALNTSVSLEVSTQYFLCELNIYQNQIRDFIYLEPDTAPVLTIRGAFPAFSYRQTAAVLRGGDVRGRGRLATDLWWTFGGSMLRGYDKTNATWLPLMPADRWEQGLRFDLNRLFSAKNKVKNAFVEANLVNVRTQTRFPTYTNSQGEKQIRDYAAPPEGYVLVNLKAGFDMKIWKKDSHFSLRADNLLNVQYRDYLDRFRYFADAVGRNVVVSWRLSL